MNEGNLVPEDDPLQDVQAPLTSEHLEAVLSIERERIERDNRQVAIHEKTLEYSDAQDKRQADFHTERIRLRDASDRRRISLVARTLAIGGGALLLVVGLFLYMMFWGSDEQASMAMSVIEKLAIGIAGWGVVSATSRLFKKLTSSQG